MRKVIINNPLDHNFKDSKVDHYIKEHIVLSVEFVNDDNDRAALERNVLESMVVILNTLVLNVQDMLTKGNITKEQISEYLEKYRTEYL